MNKADDDTVIEAAGKNRKVAKDVSRWWWWWEWMMWWKHVESLYKVLKYSVVSTFYCHSHSLYFSLFLTHFYFLLKTYHTASNTTEREEHIHIIILFKDPRSSVSVLRESREYKKTYFTILGGYKLWDFLAKKKKTERSEWHHMIKW